LKQSREECEAPFLDYPFARKGGDDSRAETEGIGKGFKKPTLKSE
jgi:hypothetical protein